jgi:hypothetical protein
MMARRKNALNHVVHVDCLISALPLFAVLGIDGDDTA